MADFASIYSMANRPTVAAESPIDAQAKMYSLANMAQQNQQGQMQTQQMQQQLQDAQELRDTIKQASSAGQSPVQAVSQLGSPTAQKWMQAYTEMAQNQTKLSKEQFDLAQAHLSKVGGDVVSAAQQPGATPQQVAQVIQSHIQQGNIPANQGQQLLQSLPSDPSQLGTWGLAQGATLGASKELLGLFTPTVHMVDTGTAVQPTGVTAATGKVAPIGDPIEKTVAPSSPGPVGKDLETYNSGLPDGQEVGPNDPGFLNWYAKVHRHEGTTLALPGAHTLVSPGSGGAGPDLSNLPPATASLVKSLGEYRTLPSDVTNPRQREQLMSLVTQAYPNYSIADAKANQKFIQGFSSNDPSSPGGVVSASERLLGHIGQILGASDKIGGSSGLLGTAWNKSGGLLKGVGNPDVAQFELEKGKIMGELNKLATGGVPHAEELASDIKNLQWTDAPEVRNRVLFAASNLGLEQTKALETRRANLLGNNAPNTSLLSPRAQAVLQNLAKRNGETLDLAPPTTAGYTATATATPNMGGGAPRSTTTNAGGTLTNLHTNGKQTIGWNGKAWVDQATGQEVK